MRAQRGWWGLALLLGVCLSAVAASAQTARGMDVDEKHLIRPGEGIGVIRLGMNAPQVHEAMAAWGAKPLLTGKSGGPAAWLDERTGAAIEAYQTDSLGRDRFGNMMKVFYVKNRVAQVSIQSVAYRTSRGANTRMSSREFRSLHTNMHPLSVTDSWGGRIRAYDSERQGLAVTYSVLSGDREVNTAQEILVHEPDTPVLLESPRHANEAAKPENGS